MKKSPFLIDKKIIISDNQTIGIKGGANDDNPIDLSIGCNASSMDTNQDANFA